MPFIQMAIDAFRAAHPPAWPAQAPNGPRPVPPEAGTMRMTMEDPNGRGGSADPCEPAKPAYVAEEKGGTQDRICVIVHDGRTYTHTRRAGLHTITVDGVDGSFEVIFSDYGIDLARDMRGCPITDEEVDRIVGLHADMAAGRIPHATLAGFAASETGYEPPYGYGCDWVAAAQFLKTLVNDGVIDAAGNALKPFAPRPCAADEEVVF